MHVYEVQACEDYQDYDVTVAANQLLPIVQQQKQQGVG
jgi:hypothetical protein